MEVCGVQCMSESSFTVKEGLEINSGGLRAFLHLSIGPDRGHK